MKITPPCTNSKLDWALFYWECGFNVIPLNPFSQEEKEKAESESILTHPIKCCINDEIVLHNFDGHVQYVNDKLHHYTVRVSVQSKVNNGGIY